VSESPMRLTPATERISMQTYPMSSVPESRSLGLSRTQVSLCFGGNHPGVHFHSSGTKGGSRGAGGLSCWSRCLFMAEDCAPCNDLM
jgi:hypothetical protein